MSEFDDIPVRVFREGRWRSLLIGELSYLSDVEIAEWGWKEKLEAMLAADPEWVRVERRWVRSRG